MFYIISQYYLKILKILIFTIMIKRKLTIKRNAVFDLNIRSIAIKNKEEYLNDLKMQAIRL